MCGIAGFFAKSPTVPAATLEAMTEALTHRGPDDQGFYGVGDGGREARWKTAGGGAGELEVGLGFRRLSILDLSENGAQPMATDDGRFTIAFNGQIYNYVELKAEMRDRFRSTCDTEVLLKRLARDGLSALSVLDGMFALALYDRDARALTLARDPFGIKPLYWMQDDRGVFFGSEIRALAKARREKLSLRRELVGRYFMNNWIPDPDTLFEGVRKLEPGHYLVVRGGKVVEHRAFWDLAFQPEPDASLAQWVDRLDAALRGTVERQLRSDVPVGFFLSGGVDSSLLATKALSVQKGRPATYTIGFKWGARATDDLDLRSARLLREKFPFDYNELILEPSIVQLLPKVVGVLEEPIADAAALCSYLICEAAATKYKVLISGQGGDELFGGYPVYQAGWVAAGLQHFPSPLVTALSLVTRRLPYAVAGRQVQNVHRAKKLFSSISEPWPDPFALLRSPLRLEQLSELLTPELLAVQRPPFARHHEHFEKAREWDRYHQMLYLDTKTYLPSLNLAYSDKTSMAHSVELRVPLLDMEIAKLVARMPSRMKLDGAHGKIVLKAVADRYLPREIVHRRKAGFGLPLREWFIDELQPLARELLAPARLRAQGLLRPETPARWLEEHRALKADHCMKLYSLMTFQLWLEGMGAGT